MTDTPDRPALAYHLTVGKGPPVVFLPGYASDMTGTKAFARKGIKVSVATTRDPASFAADAAAIGPAAPCLRPSPPLSTTLSVVRTAIALLSDVGGRFVNWRQGSA